MNFNILSIVLALSVCLFIFLLFMLKMKYREVSTLKKELESLRSSVSLPPVFGEIDIYNQRCEMIMYENRPMFRIVDEKHKKEVLIDNKGMMQITMLISSTLSMDQQEKKYTSMFLKSIAENMLLDKKEIKSKAKDFITSEPYKNISKNTPVDPSQNHASGDSEKK